MVKNILYIDNNWVSLLTDGINLKLTKENIETLIIISEFVLF